MSSETVFTKSVLKTKKKTVITAVINFNIGINFKDAFITEERTLTNKVIAELERRNKGEEIKAEEIKEILEKKYNSVSEQQTKVKNGIESELANKRSLKKEAAIDLVKEAGKDTKNRTIFTKKDFKFEFNLFANFVRYYITAQRLNGEINKIVDALMTIDDLSSNLSVVSESAKILNRETTPILPAPPAKNLPFQNGDLVFQNVVFAYPKRPQQDILRNFSFRFVRGKIYGIAGKNGIGKSTITKTTLKLYEIKEGQILIGKNNIQEIETTSLHRHVCYQTNRPIFFQMSIAENVFYPNEYDKKDLDKLVVAAQKVGIYEFITSLPNGFETILKEGGTDLSEGQKQQIKAMQMFIYEYDIYILDEILSNVHPVLKETILDNIFDKIKGSTVLVIDHHYRIFHYVDYVYQFTGEKLIKMKKSDFVS
nr:11756_t:CDS:2 [Entrophospora candida]